MQSQNKDRVTQSNESVIEYTEIDYLPYSDKKIFNLIADVERYPEFLPGWLSVDVISRTDTLLSVTQKLGVPLVNWEFKSTAELDSPRHIHISALDGPFKHLDIHWNVEPVTRQTCRVTLTVNADLDSSARSILKVIIQQSIHSLLEHFAVRAMEIYGQA